MSEYDKELDTRTPEYEKAIHEKRPANDAKAERKDPPQRKEPVEKTED